MLPLEDTLSSLYDKRPDLFQSEDSFTPLSSSPSLPNSEYDWDIGNSINNLVSGFFEGLTTLPVGDVTKPRQDDMVNKIVNSIGNLMGFVGFIPGPGTLSKVGVSSLLKATGLTKSAAFLKAMPMGIHVTSLPMWTATKITKGLERTGVYQALTATKFLQKALPQQMFKSGLHLGLASATASAPFYEWNMESLVDKRMMGFIHGGLLGAGSAAIGGAFNRSGKFDLSPIAMGKPLNEVLAMPDKTLAMALVKKGDTVNKVARMFSSGLLFGMPATMQDQPTELQIYEYLLGAYFGGRELSPAQREASELSKPFLQKGRRFQLSHPEETFKDKWSTLSDATKNELTIQAELEYGRKYGVIMEALRNTPDVKAKLDAGELPEEWKRVAEDDAILQAEIAKYGTSDEGVMKAVESAEMISYKLRLEEVNHAELIENYQKIVSQKEDLTPSQITENEKHQALFKRDSAVSEALKDNNLTEKYYNPFKILAQEISALQGLDKPNTPEDINKRYDITDRLIVIAGKNLAKGKNISTFINAVEREYKLKGKLSNATKASLIHTYEFNKQAVQRVFTKIDGEGNFVLSRAGKDGPEAGPATELHKILPTLKELEVMTIDGKDVPIQDAVGQGKITHAEIIDKQAAFGFVVGGVKTKSTILTADSIVPKEDVPSYLAEALLHPKVKADYEAGLKDYLADGGKSKENYDKNFVNNIETLKRFNFPNGNTITEALNEMVNNPSYVLGAAALNKRLQVFDAYELRPNMDIVKKLFGRNSFSYRILNSLNKDSKIPNMLKNEGEDFTYLIYDTDAGGNKIKNPDGTFKTKLQRYEAHRDGGMWMSKKAFETLAIATGHDPSSTSIKGIGSMDGRDGNGGLILKHAIHKANAEMDALMQKEGIDAYMYDTTAKQMGKRKSTDSVFDGEKFAYTTDNKYEIPFDVFTVSTADKNPTGYDKITIPQQLMQHAQDPEVRQILYDQYIKPRIEGDANENAKFTKYMEDTIAGKDVSKLESEIDPTRLSKANKIAIVKTAKDTPLWRKIVAEEILKVNEQEISQDELKNEFGIAVDAESEALIKDFLTIQGSGKKALDAIIGKDLSGLTPATLQHTVIKNYYDAMLKRWFFTEVVSPKSSYSWKAVAKPLDQFLQYHKGIKEGEFYYGEANRLLKAKITIGDKVIKGTLGELWDKYGKSNPEAFRFLVERVPMDSRAGARAMKFKGFFGDGSGIYTHPKDDVAMGGADKDIDSYFIQHDMPKKVIDYFEANKDQWFDKQGKDLILQPAKQDKRFLDKNVTMDKKRVFDPMTLLRINEAAYAGNQTLGMMLSTGKRLNLLREWALASTDGKLVGYHPFTGNKVWEAEVNRDSKPLEKILYDAVNFAADAADGNKLRPIKELQRLAIESFIKPGSLVLYNQKTGDGKLASVWDTYINKKGVTRFSMDMFASDMFKRITALDQITKGKAWIDGKVEPLTAGEIAAKLSAYRGTGQQLPGIMNKALYELGGVDFTDISNTNWFGKAYVGLLRKFDVEFGEGGELRKDIIKYLGRQVVTNINKRATALQKYKDKVYLKYADDLRKADALYKAFESDSIRNDLLDVQGGLTVIMSGKRAFKMLMNKTSMLSIGEQEANAHKTLKELRKFVETYRGTLHGLEKAAKQGANYYIYDYNPETRQKDIPRLYTKEDLTADVYATYNKIIDENPKVQRALRSYFEHLFLSRGEPRTQALQSLEDGPKKDLADIVKKYDIKEEWNADNIESKLALIPEVTKTDMQRVKFFAKKVQNHEKLLKEWFLSTNNTHFYNQMFIQPSTIHESTKVFNDLVNATFPKPNPTRLAENTTGKSVTPIDIEVAKAVNQPVIPNDIASAKEISVNLWEKVRADEKDTSIDKKNLTKEDQADADALTQLLIRNPHMQDILPDFYAHWTARTSGVGNTLETITKGELKSFINELLRLEAVGSKGLKLEKRHWWFFPDALSNIFKGYDSKNQMLLKTVIQGVDQTFRTLIKVPVSTMERNNQLAQVITTLKDGLISREEDRFLNHPITQILDRLDVNARKTLDAYTWMLREQGIGPKYLERFEKFKAEFEPYKDKKFAITENGETKQITGQEIVNKLREAYTRENEYLWKTKVVQDQNVEKFILPHAWFMEDGVPKRYKDLKDKTNLDWSDSILDVDKVSDLLVQRALIDNELPNIGIKGLDYIEHQKWIQDYEFNASNLKTRYKMKNRPFEDRLTDLILKRKYTIKQAVNSTDATGNGVIIEDHRPFAFLDFKGFDADPSGRQGNRFEYYHPHRDISQKERLDRLNRQLAEAIRIGDKSLEAQLKERYEIETGKALSEDGLSVQEILNRSDGIYTEQMQASTRTGRSEHLKHRDESDPLMTYDRSWNAYKGYTRSLTTEYYNHMLALLGHHNINKFEKATLSGENNVGAENAAPWVNFMRTSIRTALGYPAIFPQGVADNPKYKIKGNMYRVMTEDYWIEKSTVLDKWFGITKEMRNTYDAMDIKSRQNLKVDPWRSVRQAAVSRKLSALTNMEGKLSLMSLLFSPKTYLNNLVTANINTGASAGFDYLKKSYDFAHLQQINPNWTSMDAVSRDIDRVGGNESFIRADLPISQKPTGENVRRAIENITQKIRKDPNIDDLTITEYLRREGVTQGAVDAGAYFMRKSERIARRHAWLAHYLKAREVFEANGMTFKWDDPWLVTMANRGVASTQFLYSNAARPQFARTALGKVFSRFQIFTYNSVNWRIQTAKQAATHGWKEGSPEMERFTRLASADAFILALATLLPFSIFQNALPPPYNILQGYASFFFGDEKERDKAFYGVLPYPASIVQPILPPVSRYMTGALSLLATGDLDKFTSSTMWSWFPFGRFANDTRKTLMNPYRGIDITTGIPWTDMVDIMSKKEKK